ncbi:MAG: hypothetical protein AAF902_03755 [Chloroflexota bacterium]
MKLAEAMGRVDGDLPYLQYLRGLGQAYQHFARSSYTFKTLSVSWTIQHALYCYLRL